MSGNRGRDLYPPPEPAAAPVRRRRRRPFIVRHSWVVPTGLILVVVPFAWHWLSKRQSDRGPLSGYLTERARIESEYREFTGKPLDSTAAAQFDHATQLMRQGDYGAAASVLEKVSKAIPVPAVFTDLGVLYGQLKDGPRAIAAFRSALARNHDYAPVRENLARMNLGGMPDPGASEVEPNNDNRQANAVWLDRPVQALISPSLGDVDSFWFITPRPPRDRVSITVASQSPTLMPRMRIYDQNENLITGIQQAAGPGGGVRFEFSPPPNALYYLQIEGVSGSSGPYTLTVSALHAYDAYEPNDTTGTASRITPGQTVEANIMDVNDTDFFAFTSATGGTIHIEVTPRTKDLLANLGVFTPDAQNVAFAPDAKAPGDAIQYQMQVEPNQTYYIQVSPRSDTVGPYSLVVK